MKLSIIALMLCGGFSLLGEVLFKEKFDDKVGRWRFYSWMNTNNPRSGGITEKEFSSAPQSMEVKAVQDKFAGWISPVIKAPPAKMNITVSLNIKISKDYSGNKLYVFVAWYDKTKFLKVTNLEIPSGEMAESHDSWDKIVLHMDAKNIPENADSFCLNLASSALTNNRENIGGSIFFDDVIIELSSPLQESSSGFLFPKQMKEYLPRKIKPVKIPGLHEQVHNAFASGTQYWRAVGPGFFNVPMDVVIRGKRIYIQTDWGLHLSEDNGEHWRIISHSSYGGLDAYMYGFDVSPGDENFIVVAGTQIYRTYDKGIRWQESGRSQPDRYAVFRQPRFNCDGSRIFVGMGRYSYCYGTSGVKCTIGDFPSKSIFVGDAKAEEFKEFPLGSAGSEISVIYPHPVNPDIVFFAFKDGDLYITRNARAEAPDFSIVAVPDNYCVTAMAVNPQKADRVLATLSYNGKKGERKDTSMPYSQFCVFRNIDSAQEIRCDILPLKTASGNVINEHNFVSLAINPANPKQIIIGMDMNLQLLISDDEGSSFQYFNMPRKLFGDDWFTCAVREVWFGRDSEICVVNSPIGVWLSKDNLSTLIPLFTIDGKWFGNKGVAGLAHVQSVVLTDKHAYISAQDHSAWRSDGKDLSRWEKFGEPAGVKDKDYLNLYNCYPRVQGIFASRDDKYVYLLRQERKHNPGKRILIYSPDAPGNWLDITNKFDHNDIENAKLSNAFHPVQIVFNPDNSDEHWIAYTNSLYYTADGGKNFCKIAGEITGNSRVIPSALTYDQKTNILYMGYAAGAGPTYRDLSEFDLKPLYRSFDKGKNWEVFDIGVDNVKSIAVADNGNVIVGTTLSANSHGLLIVLPEGNPERKEIKCTIGDLEEEINMSQMCFDHIKTDGDNVLVIANYYHLYSKRAARNAALGALLSTDGGKTFRWIRYNLPCTWILSADIKDGIIVIGDSAGIFAHEFEK